MPTREEIREGIRGELDMWLPLDTPQRETRLINMTNSVYDKLHKQGVVIKVDMPDIIPALCMCNLVEGRGYPRCMAGYVAWKPLIEEE